MRLMGHRGLQMSTITGGSMSFAAGLLRDDSLTIAGDTVELRLRLPWMRTLPWSAIEGVTVWIDGGDVPDGAITWVYQGKAGSLDAVRSRSKYWIIGTPLTARIAVRSISPIRREWWVRVRVEMGIPYIAAPAGGPLMLPVVQERLLQARVQSIPAHLEKGHRKRSTTVIHHQEYDAIVVGSGPVGSAFARTLADERPELRILVLEAGPQTTSPIGRHVKTGALRSIVQPLSKVGEVGTASATGPDRIVARPGTILVGDGVVSADGSGLPAAAMSTDVGGMGIHWTCACPAPGEGERIPFIAPNEFDAVFADAWRLLNVTQEAFLDAPLGAEVREILSAAIDSRLPDGRKVQPMPLAIRIDADGKRYWTGTDVVLGDVIVNGVVELRADSPVLNILMDDGTATGVVARMDGEVTVIGARVVFVAADAFRTPRLLHVSGVRPKALGHYLNEHLQVLSLARLADTFIPGDAARSHHARAGVDPLSGVNWIPYNQAEFPFHGQIMQLDASPVPLTDLDVPSPGSIVGVGLFGCKEIRFEDSVEFDDEDLDELGFPAIKIHYELTDSDRETIVQMREQVTQLASALGGLFEGREPTVMPNGSSLHYMGTFRMGAFDDGESVCDSTGAVWQTNGLYVGGNGIIPTRTACNPTATSVALAIRSARAVLAGDLLTARVAGEATHAS